LRPFRGEEAGEEDVELEVEEEVEVEVEAEVEVVVVSVARAAVVFACLRSRLAFFRAAMAIL
jgi:hypothetical protein